jgi:hypothetical protein
MEIEVDCGTGVAVLSPRQKLTAALRIEPATDDDYGYSPNLIGGSEHNKVAMGVAGATIAGGGVEYSPNVVSGRLGTVGGGLGNEAGSFATVGGGRANTALGTSTVGGGSNNGASELVATVGGGSGNKANGGYATVGGGCEVQCNSGKSACH